MTGGIKKTEIVEADLGQLADEIHKVGTELELLLQILGKKPPKNEGLGGVKKDTEELTFAEKELAKQHQELGKVTAKIEQFQTNYNKEIIKTRVEINNQTTAMKQQIVQNNALEGSYDKLNATLNKTIQQYKALSHADRENVAIGGEMIKTIQLQDAQLKQLDATMGRNQRNVGNYKSGFNGLNFSIMQIGRELPSLAYGFNVFVGAISNNLPMVTDEIKRAKDELEALRIKGEKGVPIWKQLAGAIFSWQTAMVVGITVMTMYGREIGAWLQEVFKGKKAIDELRLAQESLNKIKVEGRGEAQSELTRLSLLWGALKDVNTSIETRNKIYDELNEKYPHYFKNLSDETFNLGSVEKGYWQLRDAIMATAQSRVYAESIAKNKEKLELDLKPKLEEAAKIRDDYFKENERTIKRANDAVKQIGTETFVDFYALGVSKKYKALISAEKEAGREILKVEAENFKLFNMVDVGALTNDFGTGKKNDGKAAKVAKEESAELIDIKNISNKQELEDQKEFNEETKRLQKAAYDERKAFTEQTISDSLAEADNQKLRLQEVAIDEIKLAKGNKEKILDIQHELTMNMIAEDEDAQQNILDTAGLEVEAYEDASVRIRRLRLQRGEEEISDTERTESEKKAIRQETMQATAELLSQGLSFAQQIYSAQATRAQEAYDTEMNAAGDSLEYQTLAKRKFEAEDKKIKQRQAIASKLQAVLDAGLALALAIATTWKDPFLAALNIGAATLGLGMALATPIPQFAEGTDFAPSSFIAGEEGSELIRTKSGKMILTPNKATLFSDNSLIGSSIVPHDQTQRMLANMAFNQVHDVIDMRDTNRHLSGIEKNTRNKETRYTDSKGRTVVKRGNLISTL